MPFEFQLGWGTVFNLIILFFVALYVAGRLPTLFNTISKSSFRRGWFLQRGPVPTSSNTASSPRSRASSRFTVSFQGLCNAFFLPTIPYINLTGGQCLVLLVYFSAIVLAVFAQSGEAVKDLIGSGRIAAAQLPVLFLLASKNNILSGLLGKTYEKINFIHRFAGRCVLLCSMIHSIYWMHKLQMKGALNLTGPPIQSSGFVAMLAILFILLTSLRSVRTYAYQTFLISHIVGWVGFVIGLYAHATYTRPWIIVSLVIVGLDYLVRAASARICRATLDCSETGSGMTQIRVDELKSGWKAGQHVWVRSADPRFCFQAHPFTVANSAELDALNGTPAALTLYAKNAGDFTAHLNRTAHCTFLDKATEKPISSSIKLSVEGPYGTGFTNLAPSAEQVMLVAGGSGITYLLSVFSDLVASSLTSTTPIKRLKVVYIIRDVPSSTHFLERLEELAAQARSANFGYVNAEIFVTGSQMPNKWEVEEVYRNLSWQSGRPDLLYCLSTFLRSAEEGTCRGSGAVLAACGPRQLIDSARQAVACLDSRLAKQAGGVSVHCEYFGM